MNRDQQISDIFLVACELPVQDRAGYLDEACDGDSDLRAEVESLLEHDAPDTLINDVPTDVTDDFDRDLPVPVIELPGYEILEEVGRGGLGVVFKARQIALDRIVAVKMLLPRMFPRPTDLERFRLEADTVAKLQHPNVVQIFDVIEVADNHCLCMELVEGGNLAERLDGRPQPPETAARLVEILARAMHAVHEAGYLHRDLKPANILLAATEDEHGVHLAAEDGTLSIVQPKITDFGLVRHLDGDSGLTDTGTAVGTPSYMPPEQARSDTTVTQSVDVYSLGAILYETLVGRPPFRGSSVLETLSQVYHQEPVPPKKLVQNVSADLEAVCLKCLEKDPARRYPSADALADDLRRVQNGQPTKVRPLNLIGRMWRVCQRHQIAVMLLVVAATAGLVVHHSITEQQNATRTEYLVELLLNSEISQVPSIVYRLTESGDSTTSSLTEKMSVATDGTGEKLRLTLALLPVQDEQVQYLSRQLPVCRIDQFPVVRDALWPYRELVTETLWQTAQDAHRHANTRFQAAAALAKFSPDDGRWEGVAPFVADHLTRSISTVHFGQWLPHLKSASRPLAAPLVEILGNQELAAKQTERAAIALADLSQEIPEQLCDGILAADVYVEFSPLIKVLRAHSVQLRGRLVAEFRLPMSGQATEEERDLLLTRQAIAAVTLVHVGFGDEVWPALRLSPDPSLRSMVIHYLGALQTDPKVLFEQLRRERQVSVRRAMIQILGVLDVAAMPTVERHRMVEQLTEVFTADPDPGIHAATSWTLRQWNVTLPDIPTTILSSDQRLMFATLAARIETARQALNTDVQENLPLRRAAWERRLRDSSDHLPDSLREGLVAHFSFDDVVAGQTTNAVASGAEAVFEGSDRPSWVRGVAGGAILLNGQGEHLVCGNDFAPERSDSFSIGCWVFDNNDDRGTILGRMDSEQEDIGVELSLERTGRVAIHLVHDWPENAIKLLSNSRLGKKKWHHVFVTYDGSSSADGVTVYLDGKIASTTVEYDSLTASIRTDHPLRIGMRSTEYPYRGRIDDVRIYDRMLSADDVRQIFQADLRAVALSFASDPVSQKDDLLRRIHRSQDEQSVSLYQNLTSLETSLHNLSVPTDRRWFINGQGQTMAIVQGPAEGGKFRANHTFAIGSSEVTREEYRRFRKPDETTIVYSPAETSAITKVSWFTAAAYCNWLSEQEGIPESQWVYEQNSNGEYGDGMKVRDKYLSLSGYRLPTEAEWVIACRSGTEGAYSFGSPLFLLDKYAYYVQNSQGRVHPVGSLLPNDAGLFDMHGNVAEWIQDAAAGRLSPVSRGSRRVLRGGALHSHHLSLRSGKQFQYQASSDTSAAGFRLARSVRTFGDEPSAVKFAK